ncbi:MAG: M20 metallopeptidase family protein [Thermoplasmatota archaeon]
MNELILDKAKDLESYIIDKRRDFHKHPELRFEEIRTSGIVKKELKRLGYKIIETAETGVIGVLNGEKAGETVALRADMDALAIQEENEVPYRSKVDGKMHACGHDAHTAMLLGAAKILKDLKNELDGTVKLVFQPAEEGGAGAKKMLEEMKLGDVDAIFGIHVWSNLPSGTIGTRKGPFMASSDGFLITIKGDGGHAAYPHMTNDPSVPVVDIYNALQKIITRNVDPLSHAVISTPKLKGSEAYNVIPDKVELEGTFRTFDTKVRDKIIERIKTISKHYSEAWECKSEVKIFRIPYPPTVNDEKMTEFAIDVGKKMFEVKEVEKQMGGEDFSFFLQKYPGCMLELGTGDEKKGTTFPHHHPKFDIDESILFKGTALYALLAYEFLLK